MVDPARGGPKTDNGKAIASRNALAHGINSTEPVIEGMETHDDWQRHLDGILASLDPAGALEETLAERAANLLWRLHRITRFEVAVTARQVAGAETSIAIADAYADGTISSGKLPAIDPERVARAQEACVLADHRDLDKIMRYEAHLHRQCLQTLHELEALQARRRGEQTHLARLDISTPPAAYLRGLRDQ